MKKLYVLSIISLTFGYMSVVLALPARAADAPQAAKGVILSEINWGGSGRSTADEWFEVANVTSSPIDVSGWIARGVGTSGGAINFASGSVIPANGTLLVANYTLGNQSTLGVAPDLVTTAVSIPNTKLDIALLMPDGTVVDAYVDAGTPDFGSSSTPFASMERDLDTLLWHTATQSMNLVDGTQLGSPGAISLVRDDLVPSIAPIEPTEVITDVSGVFLTTDTPVATPEFAPTETVATPEPALVEPVTVDESLMVEVPTISAEEDDAAAENVVETMTTEEPIISADFTIDDIHVEAAAIEIIDDDVDPIVIAAMNETPAVIEVAQPEAVEPIAIESIVMPIVENPEPIREVDPIAHTGDIRLNEFVVTSDEWIEFYNADTYPISLSGWIVRDASGKATPLGDGTLDAKKYLVVEKPSGKLNNDGDTIELVSAAGVVTDRVQYGADNLRPPKEGQSAAFGAEGWTLVDAPTKNAENLKNETSPTSEIINTKYADDAFAKISGNSTARSTVTSVATHTTALHASPATTTIVDTAAKAAIKTTATKKVVTASTKKAPRKKSTATHDVTTIVDIADGAHVRFTAAVIALPGTFGDRIAYLDGAQLYMNTADWPTLIIGDVVTVVGEVSTASGEKRIKLSDSSAITIGEHGNVDVPQVVTLMNERLGTLVRITGSISGRNGDTLTVHVGDTDMSVVSHDATGIHWSSLTGTAVTITGVMRMKNGELVVMPRMLSDVIEEQLTPAIISAAAPISGFPVRPVAGSAAVLGTLSTLGYWLVRSRAFMPRLTTS